jgi:putative cardiolipin synthase
MSTRRTPAGVWHWPTDHRPPEGGTLHAKAVVADGRVALVTSANLTGRALSDNIELGLLVHDAATADEITAHIAGLMRTGILARVEP